MSYSYVHYYDFSKIPELAEMNNVFSKIYDNSIKYYLDHKDGYEMNFAKNKITEFVRDLEKSLVGLYELNYIKRSNVELIKNTYKKLDTIGLLNSSYQGRIYGITYTSGGRIEINPNLRDSYYLTGSERTLLYVCHEMGHRLHTDWTELTNLNEILKDPKVQELYKSLPSNKQQFIYYGFSLLDEALTQERAEDITYHFARKNRPLRTKRRSRLFNGEIFESNFDYYGELQGPATEFAKTFKGISKESDDIALRQLSKTAIDSRFMQKIINEYRHNDNLDDLFALIYAMGIIKEASYEVFGMSNINALPQSKDALNIIKRITRQLQNQLPTRPKVFRKIEE